MSYQYEKGAYSIIPISYDEGRRVVTIGKRQGSFEGMVKDRTFKVVFVRKEKAVGYSEGVAADTEAKYSGEAVELRMP